MYQPQAVIAQPPAGDAAAKGGGQVQQTQVLSEADKQRIRAEMLLREEIRKELKPDEKKHWSSGLMAFLNSPLFLTGIAGVLITYLSLRHQQSNSNRERINARETVLQDKKIETHFRFVHLIADFDQLVAKEKVLEAVVANPGDENNKYQSQDSYQKHLEAALHANECWNKLGAMKHEFDALFSSTDVKDNMKAVLNAAKHMESVSGDKLQEATDSLDEKVTALGNSVRAELNDLRPPT